MKLKFASALTALIIPISVNASLILSPTAIINNDFGEFSASYGQENMINQSGLSSGFISGVSDFDTYISSNPTTSCNNCTPQYFGQKDVLTGVIDFDLGDVFSVNQLALGNNDNRGITNFEIFTSNSVDFTDATSVGAFTSILGGNLTLSRPFDVYDLLDTNAQYIRLAIYSHETDTLGISEIAFDVNATSAVPVPATIWLFGSGLIGLAGLARRKQKT